MSETVCQAEIAVAPVRRGSALRFFGRCLLALANRMPLLLPPLPCDRIWRGIYALAGYRLDHYAWIDSRAQLIGDGISLGENSFVNMESLLIALQGAQIRIGRDVGIGPRCCLLTVTHEIDGAERRCGPSQYRDIEIGDGCWIGANVTITAGVTIGPGCVVGTGSVVRRDLPANVLAMGNPARVLQALPVTEG
jgi:acetyltransferase-like isoleucine patch superfamily enzyme